MLSFSFFSFFSFFFSRFKLSVLLCFFFFFVFFVFSELTGGVVGSAVGQSALVLRADEEVLAVVDDEEVDDDDDEGECGIGVLRGVLFSSPVELSDSSAVTSCSGGWELESGVTPLKEDGAVARS